MIGILIIAHDSLGESLLRAVTHVLGTRPPQFEVLSVAATDDPAQLQPAARELVDRLDTGTGVVIFADIYGASPCNLACKLLKPGVVEGVAGVNLPMLVRAFTYRARDMETLIKKAVSGGCDGVLHIEVDPSSIPNHIDVDISGLKLGKSLHVSDLALPAGIKVLDDAGTTLCIVQVSKAGPEAVVADGAPEPELIRKPKPDDK